MTESCNPYTYGTEETFNSKTYALDLKENLEELFLVSGGS